MFRGRVRLWRWAGFRAWCSHPVFGNLQPYPVVESFASLLAEYGDATKQYVEARRSQLVNAYQADLKSKQDATVADETARRESLKRQFDTERRRIEDEQQRKKQRDANRISG